ncbi:tRNA (adenine22-N1)-methyltransferase [Entomoplasma freundtii]|uniref:tRNA (Adenine22-N1)-methyltransferase n=1 Tax=Entomoplasma freundtii TaxID=74700 RepID=A0A2K8NUD8_9MOLU|nr:class I SAM-dependent methyltransferase [Entomoplasma freundtii]ATZ16381.1 tRNA (adenine22-N1)-methyltransferase [Entomoplasma freundtii]TDY56580.1 tRNA (adenine22-N1)-methyltransferase [Entomoplasma freundtii]
MKSNRLNRILALVPKNTKSLFDIGTDHGYLAIDSIKQRGVNHVYAVDNRPEPLKSAFQNVSKAQLLDKITLVLSDGLQFLTTNSAAFSPDSWCVIAGLGSQTILEILQKDNPIISTYLLCSNTNPWQLRQWANEHSFALTYETFFEEKNHPYWLIKIEKKVNCQTITDIEFGDFCWYKNNLAYKNYLQDLSQHLQKITSKISQDRQKTDHQSKIKALESYLSLWN